jgi:hypothetical protein
MAFASILAHRDALWTFVHVSGVDATNVPQPRRGARADGPRYTGEGWRGLPGDRPPVRADGRNEPQATLSVPALRAMARLRAAPQGRQLAGSLSPEGPLPRAPASWREKTIQLCADSISSVVLRVLWRPERPLEAPGEPFEPPLVEQRNTVTKTLPRHRNRLLRRSLLCPPRRDLKGHVLASANTGAIMR